jgi:hypothetical protein
MIRAIKTEEGVQTFHWQGKKTAKMYIKMQEQIKVTTTHYIYSELSLIAEIGGYVGLFLGVSIYQFTAVIESAINFARKFKKVF